MCSKSIRIWVKETLEVPRLIIFPCFMGRAYLEASGTRTGGRRLPGGARELEQHSTAHKAEGANSTTLPPTFTSSKPNLPFPFICCCISISTAK